MIKSPRDIANHAESLVVSLPQRVLSVLLAFALGSRAEEESASTGKSTNHKLAAIQQARNYLANTFCKEFAAAAGTCSENLDTACRGLWSALRELEGMMQTTEGDLAPQDLVAMSDLVEDGLESAVSDFLGALFDDVVAHEKTLAKRAIDVDASALTQIAEVTKKIKFIAINASVEAARAGDAGLGFAVIASEIKHLSEQSQEAVMRVQAELG